MLAVVLLAQNTLQNLLEPKAFGSQRACIPSWCSGRERGDHPARGFRGDPAAPLTSVALRTIADLRKYGWFGDPADA